MTAHVRIGDPVSCGDVIGQGSGNCFINGIPVSRVTDLTAGHCYNPTPILVGNGVNVYFNNLLAAKVGNPIQPHTCSSDTHGGNIAVGSPNCFVEEAGASVEVGSILIQQYIQPLITPLFGANTLDDDEGSDPAYVANRRAQDPQSVNLPPLVILNSIPNPSTINPTPPPIDCSDIYAHSGSFPGSFVLSTNFTLAMVTTHTLVTGYPLRAQGSLSAADIVCNLRHLCINVLEPLRAVYGASMRINSAFRYGTGSSQHYRGEAADISFVDISTTESAWQRAQAIPTLVPFDQYIFEQNKSIWFHVSYKSVGNRHQILTKPRGEIYYAGLVKIAA